MKEISYFEKDGILYPAFALPEQTDYSIDKYGRMRWNFLKKHRQGTYTTLLTADKLNKHLAEIDKEASERVEELTEACVIFHEK